MAGNQNWRTPPDFKQVIDDEFRPGVDVAAEAHNALYRRWYGIGSPFGENGLVAPWIIPSEGILCAYCNPPFRDMMPWIKKAADEANRHPNAVCLVLGPLSRANWMTYAYKHGAEIRDVDPRIEFIDPDGKPGQNQNRTDNVLVVFRRRRLSAPLAQRWPWNWRADHQRFARKKGDQ